MDWNPEGRDARARGPGVRPVPKDLGKSEDGTEDRQQQAGKIKRPKRKAAVASEEATRLMLS